jgi:hypothetical protein
MLEKLRDILGLLSGYKQEYETAKAKLEDATAIIKEADRIASVILAVLRSWDGPDNKAH